MERKVWIFAVVGFASALAIYSTSGSHSSAADGGRLGRLARLDALMDEGKVEYRPSFFRKKIHAHIAQENVAGLEPVKAASETVAPPIPPIKDAKAEDAKKAADKKAADKKKADDAKKKKKKKKKAGGAATTDSQDESKDEKKEEAKKDDGDGSATLVNGTAAPGVHPAKNPEGLTVEEWVTFLFQNPNLDKISRFIQLAQLGTVKTDVFNKVIEKMLVSQSDQLHGYAVMALSSLPSVKSFSLLLDISNEASMSDAVRSQASTYLDQYGRLEYLRILISATASGDAQVSYAAISMIQKFAESNFSSVATSGETSTSDTERSPASDVTRIYQSALAALNSVATTSPDSNVKSGASSAASTIERLLGANAPAAVSNTTTAAI